MKNRYILFLGLAAVAASCTKDFEEFNTDTKNPSKVAGEALFSNAELTLTDQVNSTDVNLNVFKLFAQYWTETTYTDEANYDIINRAIPDFLFREYYRGFLRDFQEADSLIAKETTVTETEQAEKANKHAIIEMLVSYSYSNLVDIFGDVPYKQALNINNIAPRYDPGDSIYYDLIRRVTAAVASIDTTAGSFGTTDLIYGGDTGKWRKFGNSLLLRLGITLADYNPALSRTTVQAALAGGVFTSNADNALLKYLTAIHTNPIYQDVVQSGRNDFVPANTIVNLMNTRQDPRRPFYFTAQAGGVYTGGIYGASSPYSQYSHIAGSISSPDFPGILLTYDEVLFYLAEAAARGYTVGGTPQQYYNSAVTASITFWGGTPAQAAAYLATPSVAYANAASGASWQQKIGTQEYIAFYARGLEGFNTWRRLDYPVLNVAPAITSYAQIPKRFTYPVNEQTLNKANYEAASQHVGGDLLTTRVFWDVKDPVQAP
ncbi:MAG TPA: SusD/RagB family nutrient-binding outer membrane lipoprotein [Bacteroidales bacterium]|nr:SusD/RagB family nutrient-binding outer membrane lipoprotein [Bacteroidales bacterium]